MDAGRGGTRGRFVRTSAFLGGEAAERLETQLMLKQDEPWEPVRDLRSSSINQVMELPFTQGSYIAVYLQSGINRLLKMSLPLRLF